MMLGPFNKQKPDLGRLREIISVLIKYQFGNIMAQAGFKKSFKISFTRETDFEEDLDSTAPERLRLVLEELGTTFIKLGQVLSTRPDLVGKDIADELAKLQDEVPPFEYSEVEKVVEAELEGPMDEFFKSFKKTPIASASIAQVHRARLIDGSEVAVKVQRPDLEEQIQKDISLMRYLARQMDKRIKNIKYYNLPSIVDEFERVIDNEMDFSQEARNLEKFKAMFDDDPEIYAPKIYKKYSTNRVLTMEFIHGTKISEIIETDIDINRRRIAEIGTEAYFKMIFLNGFFHADPHAGNIFVMKNNVLCFVDFGMVGHLDSEFMDNLAELFIFTINYDIKGMINQMMYMRLIDDDTNMEELRFDLLNLLDKYYGAEIDDIGGLINEFSMPGIMVKHKIKLPKDFILLGRVLSMAEDIGRKLDPTFNGIYLAQPLIKKIIKKKLSPMRFLDYQTQYLFEIEHLLKDLPQTMNRLIFRLEEGKLKMETDLKGLDTFSDRLETMTNRISLALLISSIIIGSSLILQTDKGMPMPTIGFSSVGLIIFLIGAIFAIVLTIFIIRFGRI
ncbi:ABC1 kinase family protein [Methanobacterium alcaliphilum]|uniref:ABC1 kinase family protein n=1 Tax=Methanobacterium alcaliphilum TaxID=392018 RepID=UPI00200B47A3|nr:AarF/ABC1/UbiB kinase family protein [Methanobacterium alcaliphilum]MCK9150646.1 AarF/ABC1/UbiB kinase family protein [Methanobacterium alcaliphilum]